MLSDQCLVRSISLYIRIIVWSHLLTLWVHPLTALRIVNPNGASNVETEFDNANPRFIRNGRDLATVAFRDVLFTEAFRAALILFTQGALGGSVGPTRIPSASRGLPPSASRTSSPLWPRPALPRATRGTLRYTLQTIDTDPIRRLLLFSFTRNISHNSDRGLNKYSTHAVCLSLIHI